MKISVIKKSCLNKDLSVTNSYYGYGRDKISGKLIYFSKGYSTELNLFICKFVQILEHITSSFIQVIYFSCLITSFIFTLPIFIINYYINNNFAYEVLITILIPMVVFLITVIISFIGTITNYNSIINLESAKGEAFDSTDEAALDIIHDSAERYISDRIIECKFKGIDYNDIIQISIDNNPYWKRLLNKLF
jgi:hypothetical protein